MSDWVPVLGTVAGAVVGAAATALAHWTDRRRRESNELRAEKRRLYARFLGSTQQLFEETRNCYRTTGDDRTALCAALGAVSPAACLSDLDEIRLVASAETALAASRLHVHLRRSDVVGGGLRAAARRAWVATYWDLRHEFIGHVRRELGAVDQLSWVMPGES